MKFITGQKQSVFTAALVLLGVMATTGVQAMPFSATVLAGFDNESLVRVGALDFEIAQGDGSVRTFDYLRALGDGSVRKSGDGSVRSCDGSVMPADGACAAPLELGGFGFAGSFKVDPFLNFSVGAINNSVKPVTFVFTFVTPFVGGPYNTLATGLTGTGSADSILLEGFLDASVVPGASISCSTPAACADPVTTLSPATNASGLLSAQLSFTLQPGTNGTSTFNGSALLSQVNPQPVPEPATLALLGIGLLGAGRARRRSLI